MGEIISSQLSLASPSGGELGHLVGSTLSVPGAPGESPVVGDVVVGDQLPMAVDLTRTGADVLAHTKVAGIVTAAAKLMVPTFVDMSGRAPRAAATGTSTTQGTGKATAISTANRDLRGDDIPDTKSDQTSD